MGKFSHAELEQAFQHYWRTGAVGEDWHGFANNFTEDALYVEHVLGTLRGREAIRRWIVPIMQEYSELYTAYEWHCIDEAGDRIIVYMQNRRDHPSGSGTIDFPGVTILGYAGDGLFGFEEDYWAVPASRLALKQYQEALESHPDHKQLCTRLDWGNGPSWTRGAASYAERQPAQAR